MTTDTPYHIPALLVPTIEALDLHKDGVYVDCTYGGGGHSRAIADVLQQSGGGTLYAFDQDSEAIAGAVAQKRREIVPVYSNFRYIKNFMRYYGVDGKVDGVLADLGVSFHHFDDPERGFSFRFPAGELDMRMNRRAPLTAADVLATYSPERLTEIFRLYGELGPARRLADAIVRSRESAPVKSAEELMTLARPFVSPRAEKKEMAQIFQALRIEVNDEIGALRQLLEGALSVLRPGGRLAIITYHSLEDRLVKNFMRTGNLQGTTVKDFYGKIYTPFSVITRKPIVPDNDEIERNPRCRSAKLRVAEKL